MIPHFYQLFNILVVTIYSKKKITCRPQLTRRMSGHSTIVVLSSWSIGPTTCKTGPELTYSKRRLLNLRCLSLREPKLNETNLSWRNSCRFQFNTATYYFILSWWRHVSFRPLDHHQAIFISFVMIAWWWSSDRNETRRHQYKIK